MEIYLAGAMACYGSESDEAKKWREKAKEYFFRWGESCRIISPVDYYSIGSDDSKNPSEVMRFDLRKIREADLVLVNLKDLDKSLGTSDEIFYAYMRGIPVIGFLETEDELSEIKVQETVHPWKYEQIDRIETGEDAMEKAITYIIGYYEEQR